MVREISLYFVCQQGCDDDHHPIMSQEESPAYQVLRDSGLLETRYRKRGVEDLDMIPPNTGRKRREKKQETSYSTFFFADFLPPPRQSKESPYSNVVVHDWGWLLYVRCVSLGIYSPRTTRAEASRPCVQLHFRRSWHAQYFVYVLEKGWVFGTVEGAYPAWRSDHTRRESRLYRLRDG